MCTGVGLRRVGVRCVEWTSVGGPPGHRSCPYAPSHGGRAHPGTGHGAGQRAPEPVITSRGTHETAEWATDGQTAPAGHLEVVQGMDHRLPESVGDHTVVVTVATTGAGEDPAITSLITTSRTGAELSHG